MKTNKLMKLMSAFAAVMILLAFSIAALADSETTTPVVKEQQVEKASEDSSTSDESGLETGKKWGKKHLSKHTELPEDVTDDEKAEFFKTHPYGKGSAPNEDDGIDPETLREYEFDHGKMMRPGKQQQNFRHMNHDKPADTKTDSDTQSNETSSSETESSDPV